MLLEFTKMHGLGNDFLVLDLISQRAFLDTMTIQRLADRHFGIGFDQLLVVEPPDMPNVDFKYRIFNADGSEVEQCGNGVRCFARFVHERKLTTKTKMKVQTKAGIVEPELGQNGWVRVNMGYPKFLPHEIPFLAEEPENLYDIRLPEGYHLNTVIRAPHVRGNLNAALDHTDLNGVFKGTSYDALAYPTMTALAADLGNSPSAGTNNRLSPFSGFPALSMPAKTVTSSRSSYPMNINIEFIAREFDEPTLLNIATAFEKANPARQVPVHSPAL
jgi:hypothetical protein